MTNVFLSHKKDFAAQAQVLALALHKITPGVAIFRSEDIEKGRDWRDAVNRALEEAKCFILLYTDPTLDWSWCFYEAGAFVSNGRKPRPPVQKRHVKTIAVSTGNHAVMEHEAGFGDHPHYRIH